MSEENLSPAQEIVAASRRVIAAPPVLRGGSPVDRARDAGAQIAALNQRAQILEAELAVEMPRRLAGFDGAVERVAAIEKALDGIGKRRQELQDFANTAVADQRAAIEQARQEAADRPRLLATLRADRERLASDLAAALADAGASSRALLANGLDLCRAAGLPTTIGALSNDATISCLRDAGAVAFAIDENRSLSPENSLLAIKAPSHGPDARAPLTERLTRAVDDLVPYFTDIEAARRGQARLAARGGKTVIVALAGGVHMLVPAARAFASRAEAQRALSVAGGAFQVADTADGGAALVPAELALA